MASGLLAVLALVCVRVALHILWQSPEEAGWLVSIFAAIACGGLVSGAALWSAKLGGGPVAQLVAASCVLCSPLLFSFGWSEPLPVIGYGIALWMGLIPNLARPRNASGEKRQRFLLLLPALFLMATTGWFVAVRADSRASPRWSEVGGAQIALLALALGVFSVLALSSQSTSTTSAAAGRDRVTTLWLFCFLTSAWVAVGLLASSEHPGLARPLLVAATPGMATAGGLGLEWLSARRLGRGAVALSLSLLLVQLGLVAWRVLTAIDL